MIERVRAALDEAGIEHRAGVLADVLILHTRIALLPAHRRDVADTLADAGWMVVLVHPGDDPHGVAATVARAIEAERRR